MPGIALCLTGPLQSWGARSRWNHRDTGPAPTLSAVAGMLAAAQGHPRGTPPTWVADMGLAVRADRPGTLITDYHTANAGYPHRPQAGKASKSGGGVRQDMVVTTRNYLADAAFTVIATHPDPGVVASWAQALATPTWAPYLGRRSCPPSLPILLGITDVDPEDLLRDHLPVLAHPPHNGRGLQVGYTASSSIPVTWTDDLPISTDPRDRRYAPRGVTQDTWSIPADRCAGTGRTGWTAMRHALTHQEATAP